MVDLGRAVQPTNTDVHTTKESNSCFVEASGIDEKVRESQHNSLRIKQFTMRRATWLKEAQSWRSRAFRPTNQTPGFADFENSRSFEFLLTLFKHARFPSCLKLSTAFVMILKTPHHSLRL